MAGNGLPPRLSPKIEYILPRLFNGFPGSRSTRPHPACYLEIGMRLAPTAQAATVFLAGQQALLLRW
jgi:hypothetical protein